MNSPHIYCIGVQKSGTTTIGAALECLGYRVASGFKVDPPVTNEKIHAKAEEILMDCDAVQDRPWYAIYKYLDRRAPGSMFILTVRDPERWLASVVRHFGTKRTPMLEWFYGHDTEKTGAGERDAQTS